MPAGLNLTDRDPPINPVYNAATAAPAQFNAGLYDVLGRRYAFGVNVRFWQPKAVLSRPAIEGFASAAGALRNDRGVRAAVARTCSRRLRTRHMLDHHGTHPQTTRGLPCSRPRLQL